MADSEFSSVHWDSPPSSTNPDEPSHSNTNKPNSLNTLSPVVAGVPPEIDILQAPPTSGYMLTCSVSSPQKEADGSKDAYVSYLIVTETTMPTFQNKHVKVRRRFTDFVYLHIILTRDFPACAIPPLPGKHKMGTSPRSPDLFASLNFHLAHKASDIFKGLLLIVKFVWVEYIKGDRFGPDFTLRRASSLNRFLLRLSLHPILRRQPILCVFLESSDWNAYSKRHSLAPSIAPSRLSTDTAGVGGYIPDVFVNAFTKLHKTDRKWIELRERADKLEEDLTHVEKLVARIVRKEGEIGLDYAEMASHCSKLLSLEPNLAEYFQSFSRALDQTAMAMTTLKETTDTSYFESLRDLSQYLTSLRQLLKSRDQKQLDFEVLTDYLSRTTHERDQIASPYTGSNFIRNKVEDLRGVDHEQSRKDRLRKLEVKIADLTREVEHSRLLSEAFDAEVEREGAEVEKIRAGEMKVTLGELADAKCDFYRKVSPQLPMAEFTFKLFLEQIIDEWEKLIPEQEASS